MRTPEVELLEDDLDDNAPPSAWELALTIDLRREDLDDDEGDDLGFRALYEGPDSVLRASWRAHAA